MYHSANQTRKTPPAAGPRATVTEFSTGIQATEPSIAILPDGQIAFQGWDRQPAGLVGTSHIFVGGPTDTWREISPSPAEPTHDPYLTADPETGRVFSSNFLVPGELESDQFCAVVSFTDDRGGVRQGLWLVMPDDAAIEAACQPDSGFTHFRVVVSENEP